MFLFVEGLYLRTGDPTYKALAKRWSKVALILFAVGVVTGTILSFEFGLLWPDFMATFGDVFGLAFALEGDLVLRRGDLHRDLRLRLGPAVAARALPDRHPGRHRGLHRLVQRDRRQRLDEPPDGLRRRRTGRSSNPRPWDALFNAEHVARADPHVPRRLHRLRLHRRGRLRVRVAARAARPLPPHRAGRDARVRLAGRAGAGVVGDWAGRDGGGDASRSSWPRSRACSARQTGAPFTLGGFYDASRARSATGSRSRSCCRCSPTTTRTRRVKGLDTVPPADRPPVNDRALRVPDDGRHRHRRSRCSASCSSSPGCAHAPIAALAVVLPRGDGGRAAVVRRADRGLDHHRGRPPAVDRLRGDAHRRRR